jgi:hypothetical protein
LVSTFDIMPTKVGIPSRMVELRPTFKAKPGKFVEMKEFVSTVFCAGMAKAAQTGSPGAFAVRVEGNWEEGHDPSLGLLNPWQMCAADFWSWLLAIANDSSFSGRAGLRNGHRTIECVRVVVRGHACKWSSFHHGVSQDSLPLTHERASCVCPGCLALQEWWSVRAVVLLHSPVTYTHMKESTRQPCTFCRHGATGLTCAQVQQHHHRCLRDVCIQSFCVATLYMGVKREALSLIFQQD